mmetsp:Transcript_19147/g.44650  ORF Transcript_19147/g.44650 Transcript_19147/m.44650 type:complete len:563 (-) Transcript_19147:109-1797(-)
MESHLTTSAMEMLPTSGDGSWTMATTARLTSEDEEEAYAAACAAQALSENDDAVYHAAAAALGEPPNHDNDDVIEAAAQAAANGDVIASSTSDAAVENHLFSGNQGSSIQEDADAVVATMNEKIDFPPFVVPPDTSTKLGNDFMMPSAAISGTVAAAQLPKSSSTPLNFSRATVKEGVQVPKQTQNMGSPLVLGPMGQERSSSLVTSESEELEVPTICRICEQDDGRPLLRFLPVPHDISTANAAPSVVTFTEDLCLHIFCGKTASILPTVNRPDLEILTKAGLKNKHGIGPEVNSALARTRCGGPFDPSQKKDSKRHMVKSSRPSPLNTIPHGNSSKEKQYYLVREFEAHLAAIRNTQISFTSDYNELNVTVGAPPAQPLPPSPPPPPPPPPVDPYGGDLLDVNMDYVTLSEQAPAPLPPAPPLPPPPLTIGKPGPGHKLQPIKAHAGHILKPNRPRSSSSLQLSGSPQSLSTPHVTSETLLLPTDPTPLPPRADPPVPSMIGGKAASSEIMPDGKIRCACGGTHLPIDGHARGNQSWWYHIATKRHQKWMEEKGLINGAV